MEPVLASEREERLQVENVVAPPCQQGGLPISKEAVVCLPASKEGFLPASKRGGVVLPARERGQAFLPARKLGSSVARPTVPAAWHKRPRPKALERGNTGNSVETAWPHL